MMLRDVYTMARLSFGRVWCRLRHRSMWKVWDRTTHYRSKWCRICGREHATRVWYCCDTKNNVLR